MQQNFAEIIKNARTRKGLSQRQLAKNIAISHTYSNKMERGTNSYPPSKKVLNKLASELDLDIQYLEKISGRIDANAIASFQQVVKQYPQIIELLSRIESDEEFAQKIFEQVDDEYDTKIL